MRRACFLSGPDVMHFPDLAIFSQQYGGNRVVDDGNDDDGRADGDGDAGYDYAMACSGLRS